MAVCAVSVEVRKKWWAMPSIHALSFFYRVTGRAPDLERVATWYARHGFVVYVDGKRTGLRGL